jgi:hypothetical protein
MPTVDDRSPGKSSLLADCVLIAGGTLAIWALSRDLHASGWLGLKQFARGTGLFEPALLAGLAALFFAAISMRPAVRNVAAAALVLVAMILYSAEFALATGVMAPATDRPYWSIDRASPDTKRLLTAQFGSGLDLRSRHELLDDLRGRGVDAVPAVMLFDILEGAGTVRSRESIDAEALMPIGGVSDALTVLCNESQYVSYHSDEHGFRNPRGVWDADRIDIAAVGESFIQGYCVPDGKTFVDLLRTGNRLVMNLGISGESSLLQLAAIKEYLPRYRPRIVLWFFCEGIDLPDLLAESANPLLMRYLDGPFSQRLIERQGEIDGALRRVIADIEARERQVKKPAQHSLVDTSLEIAKLWHLRDRAHLTYRSGDYGPEVWSMLDEKSHNLLRQTLANAQSVVGEWGGSLYFVYLPSWDRYRNSPRALEREHNEVSSLVKGLGIPIVDVKAAFERHGDPLSLFPYHVFGHYNEQGNQVVAETVLKSLSGEFARNSTASR